LTLLPIPPEDPRAPKYWRDEIGGQLAAAVRTYLDNPDALTMRDIAFLRAYFRQWVNSPAWDMNPHHDANSRATLAVLRGAVPTIASARDVQAWLNSATEAGLDPL
jgi:hypothetical protein